MKYRIFIDKIKGWAVPFFTALTIASGLEPLLVVSKVASTVLEHWNFILATIWGFIFKLIYLNPPASIYEPATVSIFAIAMGVSSSKFYRNYRGLNTSKLHWYVFLPCLLFNVSFYLTYLALRTSSYMQNNVTTQSTTGFWEDYLPILAFYIYIFCVGIASQKILTKKLITTIIVLLIFFSLDRIYEPLEKFL